MVNSKDIIRIEICLICSLLEEMGIPPKYLKISSILKRRYLHNSEKMVLGFLVCLSIRAKMEEIIINIKIRPDNLWGIARRMQYRNRKYHSGLI